MATTIATLSLLLILLMMCVFVQPAVIPNDTEPTISISSRPSDTDVVGLTELMNEAFGANNDDEFTTSITFLPDSTTPLMTVDRTEVPTTSQIGLSDASTKPTTAALDPQELLIPPATVNASIAQMHNTSHRQLAKR